MNKITIIPVRPFLSVNEKYFYAFDNDGFVSICDGERKVDTTMTLQDFLKTFIDNLYQKPNIIT